MLKIQTLAPGIEFPRDFEKLDWRTLDDLVELPIAWDLDTFNLRGEPHARAAQGAWVTPGACSGAKPPKARSRRRRAPA